MRLSLIALASVFAFAEPPSKLPAAIDEILSGPAARGTLWGIQVYDLENQRVIFSRNEANPFIPASNTKLFSTAVGLLRLGPDYRFETKVFSDPASGDLILCGGGDPMLDSTNGLEDLADQLVEGGLRRVRGNLVGDDTQLVWSPYPDGWTVNDTLWGYGAAISALTLDYNTITVTATLETGAETPVISIEPPVEFFTLTNALQPGDKNDVNVERQPGSFTIRLSGTMRPGGRPDLTEIGVHDPALFAAHAFADALRRRGVVIEGRVVARHRLPGEEYQPNPGTPVAWHQSPSLIEMVRFANKKSHNLTAELILLEAARVTGAKSGPDAVKTLLAELGIGEEEFTFADGSGLARRTLVSPRAVIALLQRMHNSMFAEEWWNALAIPGEIGTLETRFRAVPEASMIHAKTGTISHVAALSGYAGLDPTTRLAFSIIANNHNGKSSEVRAIIDRIGAAILLHGVE